MLPSPSRVHVTHLKASTIQSLSVTLHSQLNDLYQFCKEPKKGLCVPS